MILRREYVPRPYAPLALDFMSSRKRCALWAAPGMGKTSLVYTLIDSYFVAGLLTAPVLVIGPLRVARDTWTDEVLKWDHLRELDTAFIGGTKQQREAALKKDAQVFTTNYEQIPWLVEKLGGRWPFQMVVADESTRLKGFRLQQGTRRAQALSKVAFQSEYWINLTGTPAPNGLTDLWGQTWFLDQGQRLGTSYSAFCERWFYRPPKDGGGSFGGKLKAFKHSEKEIHSALRDICLTLDPKDWFNLQEPVVTQIKVKLPPDARRIYDEFEATMFAELADQTSRTNVCRLRTAPCTWARSRARKPHWKRSTPRSGKVSTTPRSKPWKAWSRS
jgi:SNF2 family DNA or RNA helicase